MVFPVAWRAWSPDNTDFNLFALVLRPALTCFAALSIVAMVVGRATKGDILPH